VADFSIERSHLERGCPSVAGVDEVGRGALCGPVVAAAVLFPPSLISAAVPPAWLRRINDSKLLSPRRREELVRPILEEAASVGVGWSVSGEVDRLNVFHASHAAMRRAVHLLSPAPGLVLVDGVPLRACPWPQEALPQGDRRSSSIAAASILAKVLRDAFLRFCDPLFSGYGLAGHKGYGTAAHYRALDALGPCPFHRRSFQLQWPRKLFE
jgi:ribonuclease HII